MWVDTPWETFSRHWVQLLRWWQVHFCWHRNTLNIWLPPNPHPTPLLWGGSYTLRLADHHKRCNPTLEPPTVTTWPVTSLSVVLARCNGVSSAAPSFPRTSIWTGEIRFCPLRLRGCTTGFRCGWILILLALGKHLQPFRQCCSEGKGRKNKTRRPQCKLWQRKRLNFFFPQFCFHLGHPSQLAELGSWGGSSAFVFSCHFILYVL